MKSLLPFVLTALPVALLPSCNSAEIAQDGGAAIHEMTEEEIMMKMMEAGAPGEAHAELAKTAGEWKVKMSHRMDANSPWETSEGTSSIKMTLGGRYMVEQAKFDFGGMQSDGILFVGFDNTTQKYQSVWMDSWGTRMMYSEGTEVSPGNIEFHGSMHDFITPEGRPYKYLVEHHSDDSATMTMWDTIPASPDAPMPAEPNVAVMKMEYTRAQG